MSSAQHFLLYLVLNLTIIKLASDTGELDDLLINVTPIETCIDVGDKRIISACFREEIRTFIRSFKTTLNIVLLPFFQRLMRRLLTFYTSDNLHIGEFIRARLQEENNYFLIRHKKTVGATQSRFS